MLGKHKSAKNNNPLKSFEAFYYQYRRLVFKTALSILHNYSDAEDAVDMTFIKAYKAFSKIKKLSEEKRIGFLIIVAKNTAINIYNKNMSDAKLVDKILEDTPEEELIADFNDDIKYGELKDIIKKLPESSLEILYMRCLYGCTFREIGSVLNISASGAKKRFMSAREELRKLLEEVEDEAESKSKDDAKV